MKKISQDQIKEVLAALHRLNPPIQAWETFVKFFELLPEIKEDGQEK